MRSSDHNIYINQKVLAVMAVASTINYSIQRLQNVNHTVIYLFPLLDDTAMNVCRRAGG